jgi:hypothetical protein
MFVTIPHHTIVLAMFYVCTITYVCVRAFVPVPHFLIVQASQLFCIDSLKPHGVTSQNTSFLNKCAVETSYIVFAVVFRVLKFEVLS